MYRYTCLKFGAKHIRNTRGKDDTPHQQSKQCGKARAFSVQCTQPPLLSVIVLYSIAFNTNYSPCVISGGACSGYRGCLILILTIRGRGEIVIQSRVLSKVDGSGMETMTCDVYLHECDTHN